MRRLGVATMTAAACVVAMAVPGAAAPQSTNKNFEAFPVVCENGTRSVVVHKTNESRVAFDEEGRPLVVQAFAGELDATFEIQQRDADGSVVAVLETGTVDEAFQETRGERKGTEGRTMDCTFTDTFSFVEPLTAEEAAFLDEVATDPVNAESYQEYVGQTLVASGTFLGTATVMTPGRK